MKRIFLLFLTLVLMSTGASPVLGKVWSPCDWNGDFAWPEDYNDLSGRLGSTRDQWESFYGPPTKASNSFPEYEINGCGPILTSFSETGYLESISIFSPRTDPNKSLESPDPADWSISAGFAIAEHFAPSDHALEPWETTGQPYSYIIAKGYSPVLLDNVPKEAWDYSDNTPQYGYYVVVLWQNENNDVAQVKIELGFDEYDFPSNW